MSGEKGEPPRRIRVNITRKVSKIGIPNTAMQNAMTPKLLLKCDKASLFDNALNIQHVSAAPIISVPPSPINIFDFCPKALWK